MRFTRHTKYIIWRGAHSSQYTWQRHQPRHIPELYAMQSNKMIKFDYHSRFANWMNTFIVRTLCLRWLTSNVRLSLAGNECTKLKINFADFSLSLSPSVCWLADGNRDVNGEGRSFQSIHYYFAICNSVQLRLWTQLVVACLAWGNCLLQFFAKCVRGEGGKMHYQMFGCS